MALMKQPISINFSRGLDTKTDPYQVSVGNFLELENSVFTTTGRLTKRNGYKNITNLPSANNTTLTTLNDSLVATGTDLFSYSEELNSWIDQGRVQPVQLDTTPLVRVSTSQTSPDSAIAPSGIVCLAYLDGGQAYYQISDSATGQQIVKRTTLPATAVNPRVFTLGVYFIVMFAATVAGTPTFQYVAIPFATPSSPNAPATIATTSSVGLSYDAYSFQNQLFITYGVGNTVRAAYIDNTLALSPSVVIDPAHEVDLVSVTVDASTSLVWISYWGLPGLGMPVNGFTAAINFILGIVVTPTQITPDGAFIKALTSIATQGTTSIFYQTENFYNYTDSASNTIQSDFTSSVTVMAPVGVGPGVVGSTNVLLRSVGLASKPFLQYVYTLNSNPLVEVTAPTLPNTGSYTLISSTIYMLVNYGPSQQTVPADNSNQITYFLVDSIGNIYMRLAYANAGGYAPGATPQDILPNVTSVGSQYFVSYLIADFLATVNKGTNLPAGTPTNAIYTQYGINLAKISINSHNQYSAEIAGALHLTGGQLWEYDGVRPVEHGFHLWPENVVVSTSGSGGHITAGTYFYVFTYEWTDAAGNLHRSAPSIPVSVITTGSTSTNTIHVPTLRLTYKLAPNPVRLVGYRWSSNQQVYYQFTSITSPVLNDVTIDSRTITDIAADPTILGQTLLYTTGGVIEDIAAPASVASALFSNRLFLVDAEDRNLLWYSKQVIENVPVEMSDLLTLYIAPTTGAQGSTGPVTALSAMDDKLIIFKKDAIYYINGSGPDNTGANSTFSDPVFITSTVGCSNPNSIVLMKDGLMFQSDKGIWLLGRDLSTNYIGFGVEEFNSNTVMSASSIPATNQVRFVLDNNVTLMYDYFVNQWGTHTNINAISATLWQGMHSYLNIYGQVYQEVPGIYLDGPEPVLMALTTSWLNVAGLQGYERFYFANLLGTYHSPFKLNVGLAYDYNPSPTQAILVTPDNQSPNWGGEALWGSGRAWGGSEGPVFTARLFPNKQKCQSFQVSIQELYDPSFAQPAGQGLSLSGLALVVGVKKGYRTQSAKKSFG